MRLSNFEGPLDLLLHLIKKNEVNVYDIPIALITRQYLDYLELMQRAGPRGRRRVPRDGGHADPHQVAHAAAAAGARAGGRRRGSARGAGAAADRAPAVQGGGRAAAREARRVRSAQWMRPDERVAEIAGEEYEPELEVDLFSLLTAFRAVVERAKQRPTVPRARRADLDRDADRAAARRGCRRPRPAGSRTCSPTPPRGPT